MTKSAFAERLIDRAKELNITLAEAARRAELPYHQVHSWTRRENAIPKATSLREIAAVLETTPEFLLYGTPIPDAWSQALAELQETLPQLSEAELHVLLAAAKAMRDEPQRADQQSEKSES